MTPTQKADLKIALRMAFAEAINEVGLDAFKRTSMFGSNDAAYKAASLQKAA